MMMMINRQHPTVEVEFPPWDSDSPCFSSYEDPITNTNNTNTNDYFSAFKRYLPSSSDSSYDAFRCDNFRMYEFKVRKCSRGRSHDWTECPYAHPGEKARRRDPRKYHYSGTACPDFRRGICCKGDSCEYSHGVFECWLHPARYRTQPCKDGPHCKRRVCFFAHSPDQLRLIPPTAGCESPPPSAIAKRMVGYSISPTSVFETFSFCESPPMSPSFGVSELATAMRDLQIINKRNNVWDWGVSGSAPASASPGSPSGGGGYMGMGPSVCSPTRRWAETETETEVEVEVPMERVESGKDVRARMYAKLSKENSNSLVREQRVDSVSVSGPDLGWVFDLVN